MRKLIVTAAVAVGVFTAAAPGVSHASASPHSAALAKRPDRADWEEVMAAAHMRRIGLARHRTAHFRSYAGELGLSELATIHPLAPGRCREALRYLYGNLLDLENAEPGENWTPLRRLVAREPSIRACAPRRTKPAP